MKSISFIVPMYNEQKRIKNTVQYFNKFLRFHPNDEVIFVNDGSTDHTISEIYKYRRFPKRMRVYSYEHNIGKWYALFMGNFLAKKQYCVMVDADLSIDPEIVDDIRRFLRPDVLVIGNRYGKFVSEVPIRRFVVSRIFNFLVRFFLRLPYRDSQAPFKVWKRGGIFDGVFYTMLEEGFAGDIEFIKLAQMEGVKIIELDVFYEFAEGSSINILKHGFEMFKAIFRVRKRIKLLYGKL